MKVFSFLNYFFLKKTIKKTESLFTADEYYWDESNWIYSNLEWKPNLEDALANPHKVAAPIQIYRKQAQGYTNHALVVNGHADGQGSGAG